MNNLNMKMGVSTMACDAGKSGIGQYAISLLLEFSASWISRRFCICLPFKKLMEHPEPDRRLAANARRMVKGRAFVVENHFNLGRYVTDIEACLQETVAGHKT